MSEPTNANRSKFTRRKMLNLSAAAGAASALPGTAEPSQGGRKVITGPGICSTPPTAVAMTRYGKVRGYVDDGVLTFKGVPYAANTGGENRWKSAQAPTPWDGELPALTYGANCPQRLHDWPSEQTFLQQWTDGWHSEDMLKVNIWTSSLTGRKL